MAAMTLWEGQVLSSLASEDSPSSGSCQQPSVLVTSLLSGVTRRPAPSCPCPTPNIAPALSQSPFVLGENVRADES